MNPRITCRRSRRSSVALFTALFVGTAVAGPTETGRDSEREAIRYAVTFSEMISPMLFDAAVDSFASGEPSLMVPLSEVFPHDPNIEGVAEREDAPLKNQWLTGGSLLTAPVARDDGQAIESRDIYIPEGRWFSLATGQCHEGPMIIEDHAATADQPPAFIGGHGLLLTRSSSGALACVAYPTIEAGIAEPVTFTLRDGQSIVISRAIIRPRTSNTWVRPVVTDGYTGERQRLDEPRFPGSITFSVSPGGRYVIDDDGIGPEHR